MALVGKGWEKQRGDAKLLGKNCICSSAPSDVLEPGLAGVVAWELSEHGGS